MFPRIQLGLMAIAAASSQAQPDLHKILTGVEDHYNKTQTLQVSFSERYTGQGRTTNEKGELFLRKPGKMRWQYSVPAGELYISDGKYLYAYHPSENRAEKSPMKEMEDMRGPLAFLLGRLNFENDFREFRTQPDRENVL